MEQELDVNTFGKTLFICLSSIDGRASALSKSGELPYVSGAEMQEPVNLVTGLPLRDLSRITADLAASTAGIVRTGFVTSACVSATSLELRKDSEAARPFLVPFLSVSESGSVTREMEYCYFLDGFTDESIVRTFNLASCDSFSPAAAAAVHTVVRGIAGLSSDMDSGALWADRAAEAVFFSGENISARQAHELADSMLSGAGDDARSVFDAVSSYYLCRATGAKYGEPDDKEGLLASCRRLSGSLDGGFARAAYLGFVYADRLTRDEMAKDDYRYPEITAPSAENLSVVSRTFPFVRPAAARIMENKGNFSVPSVN